MTPVAHIGATLPVPLLLPPPASGPAARERRGTVAPTAIRPTPEAPFRHAGARPQGPRADTEGSRRAQGRQNVGRQNVGRQNAGRQNVGRRDNGSDDPPADFSAALSAPAATPVLAQIFSSQPGLEAAPGDGPAPVVRQAGIAAYRSAQSALAGEPDLQQEIDGLLVVRDHPAIDLTV